MSETALFKYFLKIQATWGKHKQTERGKLQSFRNWKRYIVFNHGQAELDKLTRRAEQEAQQA